MRPAPLIAAALVLVGLLWRWRDLSVLLRSVLLLAAGVLCAYGVKSFDLPSLEHVLLEAGQALGTCTYLLVGALAFLETGAGVGLVIPGEVAVVAGGVTAGQGETNIFVLIGVVWACALAGDAVSYLIGRRLGREWARQHGAKLKLTPKRIAQMDGFFDRHGMKAILLGRFVGFIRAFSPFLAGASRMPPRRFIPAAALAAGLWSATFSLLGYVSWQSFAEAVKLAKQGTIVFVLILAVAIGGLLLYRWLRDRSRQKPDGAGPA